MRRTFLPGLLLAVALVAAACGGGDDSGDAGGGGGGGDGDGDGSAAVDPSECPVDALETAGGPVEITLWHAMPAENEATLAALTDDYNASQDKVRVRLAFQGTYDETADKLVTAFRGGDLPAIAQLEETRLQLMIDSGALLPAQACAEAAGYDFDDHLEAVVDEFTVEDVLWPMPFNVSSPILYFNARAFEQAGLPVDDPPATFPELRAAAEQIVASGAARYGFAVELSPGYIEQWLSLAGEPVVNEDNGRAGRADEVVFGSEKGEEVYAFLDQLVDDGLGINVGTNVSGVDAFLALASGDAAMTLGTSAALGSIFAVLESGQYPDVELGVGSIPRTDEADDGSVVVGGGALYLLARGTSPEQRAASWDYVRWLNEPEQQARWHAGTGYLPIRRSAVDLPEVADLWAEKPAFRVAYDQLTSRTPFTGPAIGPYKEVRDAIVTSLERMLLQNIAPEVALAEAVESANDALASYNRRVGD